MMIIGIPLASVYTGYTEAKYMGVIFFGYTYHRVFPNDKAHLILN